ncbi:MAG: cobalamin biosynthesis protein [Spirochaetaceae bacterium]|nr:cobalamin biosynthesis protein [Spirochaetaceae bacterium]
MIVALFSFTAQGARLKDRLSSLLAGQGHRILPVPPTGTLRERTGAVFQQADALVFIGAAGIAVRAVAPFLVSKATDPAVVAVDELAYWAVSLASGHIGGANGLTRTIASLLGSQAVITTATDLHGCFALDLWARANGLRIAIGSWDKVKVFSARLLSGETLPIKSDYPIAGAVPSGITLVRDPRSPFGAVVSAHLPEKPWAHLVPQGVYAGIGCRKGASLASVEQALALAFARAGLSEESVAGVGTVSLKKDEPALALLCEKRNWRFLWYPPEELMAVPGEFSSSPFVMAAVGADNVCERAAVLASCGGTLILPKCAYNGVTVAAAERPPSLSFGTFESFGPGSPA